jgi:hypothetical protein
MKFVSFALAVLALVVASPSWANGEDHHKPQHGGLVAPGVQMDLELVAKPERIVVYVSDHGKKGNTAGATGKLTLLSGKEKAEAVLKPVGEDRMEAEGPFKLGPGTKLVASVVLANKKSANARFTLK